MTEASNESTIDNWKPKADKPKIICSEWRQNQIGEDFNQRPGLDELRKIHRFIKNKAADSEIMKAFGINAETLVAIKKNKYDPIRGISLDNQSKIYKEFKKVEDHVALLIKGINCLADVVFIDKQARADFKKILKNPYHVGSSKSNLPKLEEAEDLYSEEE